jgi:hypothetical protein
MRRRGLARVGTRRRVMTSRSASPRPALADGRDGTVETIDPLAFLRADAATQATLAREVLPKCRQTTSVLKILERIEDACVARARLGVTDARRRETRSLAFVEPANGSTEAEEKRTMGEDEVDAFARGVGDAAATARPEAMDYALECERSRDEASGTKLWMTCDALVFVVSGEITSERAGAPGPAARASRIPTYSGTKTNEKTTQCPEVGCYRRNQNASAVKTLRGTSVLKAIGEIAACVERMGEDDVFVVCERVGETDDMRGVNIRDALVKLTGVREDNVFCVKECGDEGLRDAGGGKLDESTGGWFNGAGGKKTVARDFQLRLENWHEKWSANRTKKLRDTEYDKIREQIQFWAMFLRKDDESLAEERDAPAAESPSEDVVEDAEDAGKEKEDPRALARVHESGSLMAVHKFLKTAVEGVPMAGIPGAPEMAWNHFQKYPQPERAPLMNAAYSHNVIQYAAALMFAWLTPGPVGAHATHFTNRFRICLFFACLSGASPLDPEVVTTVIGLAAGTDKENLEMSPVIRFMDNADASSDEEFADARDAPVDEELMDIDGEAIAEDASSSSETSFASLASISTIMQDALDRAIAEGNDLKDRASKMLVDFLNSGNREVLASRRRAMKTACEAKADALQLKKMSYDEAEALGKKVFNRAFTRDVSKRVSTLIFGPKFIASVAADLTQILNSSFTTYIATSSIDIFLPMVEEHEEKMRLKNEEDAQNAKEAAAEAAAAAVAALTVKNGFVRVTLSAEDDGFVRCDLTPTPLPTTVEKLLNTSKMIGERTVALTTTTASTVSLKAEAMSTWASKTSDSVRKETNRGLERAQENAKASLERAQENAKASLERAQENAKAGLENVSVFFDRTKSSINDSLTSSATTITNAFASLKGDDVAAGSVSIDVRSLPVQRVAAALENEEVDRVIVSSNLVLKMPKDLILSKALGDIYKELREDAASFVKYQDDETVLRAIQRLLELVVESGDEIAINELIKLGVVPRPKSAAQAKLEAWRENFRRSETTKTQDTDADAPSSPSSRFTAASMPTFTMPQMPQIPDALKSSFAAPMAFFSPTKSAADADDVAAATDTLQSPPA